MKPSSPASYKLLHDGSLALAEVEANGIRIDVDYLKRTQAKVDGKIAALTQSLRDDSVWATWRRAFGQKAKLTSRPQLAKVLYGELGIPCEVRTATGKPSTDEEVLGKVDHPFVRKYFRLAHFSKLRSTYITALLRETVDGFLHPFFHLHTVTSFRGSSADPNFQNLPIRDPYIGGLLRRAFVPRESGWSLVETDYGAMEFKIAACVWADEAMLAYASDPAKDVHRDFTSEIFGIPTDEVSKPARHLGKNQFVFPVLYGSWWKSCAEHIWGALDGGLRTQKSDRMLSLVLKDQGITRLKPEGMEGYYDPVPGTFEHQVYLAEKKFLEVCPVFAAGKDRLYADYCKRGYFQLHTGFVCQGICTKNFVLNARVQGPAFHCLLWSLIRLVKELRRREMRAKVVGQIHDCVLADVPDEEIEDYLELVERIMTKDIREHWSWIKCPLSVEPDVASDNWHSKKPWVKRNGRWQPKPKA